MNYPFLSDYKRVWDIDLAIDAYAEEIAKEHGQVHPDEEWAENIAAYVAGFIDSGTGFWII